MTSLIIGFVAIVAVLGASLGAGNVGFYFQPHSLMIVGGGTLALLFLATPNGVLRSLVNSIAELFRNESHFANYQGELMRLIQNKTTASSSKNEMIAYASELWSQGVDPDLFVVLLSQRRKELESRTTDSVQALKNLSKYPPALGMCGTVMGMIALFANLDQNKSNIGGHLSLAMTATFFGLILTNAIVSPLADRLHVRHVHQQRVHDGIYEILLLINRGEAASLIKEEMNERAA